MRRILTGVGLALLVCVASFAAPQPQQSEAGLLSSLLGSSSTRLAVQLSPDASINHVVRVLSRLGLRVTRRYDEAGLLVVETTAVSLSLTRLVNKLTGIAGIEIVEIDRPMRSRRFDGSQSNFAMFEADLEFSTMAEQPAFRVTGIQPKHKNTSAKALPVAIVDGGFQAPHEALPASAIARTWDALEGDSDVVDRGNGYDDDHDGWRDGGVGHGHAVASLIHVVAPRSPLFLARVLDDEGEGSFSSVAAGVDWALRQGAAVINLSLGSAYESRILERIIADARERGVVVVASAGNEPGEVSSPARGVGTLAVAGVHNDGGLMDSSGTGFEVDLGAPGFEIIAPWPGSTERYGRWTGASFATAITTGALVVVANGNGIAAEEALALVEAALAPYRHPQWGAGRGQVDVSKVR